MTFDDDFLRLLVEDSVNTVMCIAAGVDWPPPPEMIVDVNGEHFLMKRSRMSAITDEQRQGMTHVCRGAEYVMVRKVSAPTLAQPSEAPRVH